MLLRLYMKGNNGIFIKEPYRILRFPGLIENTSLKKILVLAYFLGVSEPLLQYDICGRKEPGHFYHASFRLRIFQRS